MEKEKKVISVDCEPLWENIFPLFIEWIEFGTKEQKRIARDEIEKMAKITDIVRQEQKKAQKRGDKTFTMIFDV